MLVFEESLGSSIIAQEALKAGVEAHPIFKAVSPKWHGMRRLHQRTGLPFWHKWLDLTAAEIRQFEKIIIFDSVYSMDLARWCRNSHPQGRIILWHWNPAQEGMREEALPPGVEGWTFDPGDSQTYGLILNTQFYFSSLGHTSKNKESDIVFIGRDKGRAEYLAELKTIMTQMGLSTIFNIVGDGQAPDEGVESRYIPYRTAIDVSARSRAILDIVQTGQRGLTLRAMEALYLNVKLVTNNPEVLTDSKYPDENVFLLNARDIHELPHFLARPVIPASASTLKYYEFHQWLRRFDPDS